MPSLSRTLPLVAGGLVAGGAAALRHPVFGGTPSGERLARMRASPQWVAGGGSHGGRFRHPVPTGLAAPTPATLWQWFAANRADRTPTTPVPTLARTRCDLGTPADLRVTWLGHATALVEVDGRRLLTDPVFSRHASPGPLFGVARFFEPPLPLDALPDVDAVLLTHDHYDHLDYATVRRLAPVVPRWIAPLGVGAHLERWGVAADRITELDWWDAADVAGVTVTATPSRHFSGRGLTNRDTTLWCGYAVAGAAGRVYLTGDGGMQPQFAEVGERLGPFDVTLAEAGAYHADWADIHLGPEQAVAAVRAARGGLMLPVHWGTFNLSFHGWTEPAERVLAAADAAGVRVAIPRPGESVEPADPPAVERWWPEIPWQSADDAPVVSSGLE